MTKPDKGSSDEAMQKEGETSKADLPSSSPDRLKASLANLRKHGNAKIPSPKSAAKSGATHPLGGLKSKMDQKLRLPSPDASDEALDEESEPDLGTDRISPEDLEALSFSEVSFVMEDSEVSESGDDDEEVRTEIVSGSIADRFSLRDDPSDGFSRRPARVDVLTPLSIPSDEEYDDASTQMISGDFLDDLSMPQMNEGYGSQTLAEDSEESELESRTEMVSAAELGMLEPEEVFGHEATQLAESPFAHRPQGQSVSHGAREPLENTEPSRPGAEMPIDASMIIDETTEEGQLLNTGGDDDFHGEKTELYDSPFENDPICPKLSILAGPTAGQEFLINRLRNTVGRGTNNTIIIGDMTMSRQHFEIHQNPDESYFLKDLNSNNGTQLNGSRVKEADLLHGDRIEAGETTFQFLIPGTVPPPTRQRRVVPAALTATVTGDPAPHPAPVAIVTSSKKGLQKALLFTTIGAIGLSLVLAAAIIVVATGSSEPAGERLTASQMYMQGVEAVQARDWDLAEEKFKNTLELEPKFENVAAQLERIDTERRARAFITEAQSLSEGEGSEALLAGLDAIGTHSVYFDEATQLARQLRRRRINTSFENAQRLAQANEHEQALVEIAALLETVPNHEGALALREDINTRGQAPTPPEPATAPGTQDDSSRTPEPRAQTARVETPRPPRDPAPARAKTAPADDDWTIEPLRPPRGAKAPAEHSTARPAPVVNFTEGFRLYQARNFKGAADHFQAIASGSDGALAQRAGRLASDVRRFERSFGAANEAMGSRRWSQAVRHLDEAKRTDVAIAGDNSAFQRVIGNLLATAHAELGLVALGEGELDRARNHHRQGRSNNSSDPTVQRLGRELESR